MRGFAPGDGIPIPESGKFCMWNPKSWAVEFESSARNPECH